VSQVPLLSGIKATERADFSLSYPVNLEPVPLETGISKGHLRSTAGATTLSTGPGLDRGGIVWNGAMYRVMGSKLVTVSLVGVVTILGEVGAGAGVKFERFDAYLAVRSGTALYYWNGITLVQVTDPDLGACLDIARLKGQLFSTDGKYIIATQLSDPTQVDPLKYGAAESDPDAITGLLATRNELYACGQFTVDVFSYSGGTGFPLQLSEGATIPYGVCGALAKVNFAQTFAFVGSAEGEALGVWLAGAGTAAKLSTRAIDDILAKELNPAAIVLEKRVSRDEQRLFIHLSERTLVYLQTASVAAQQAVWYEARSGLGMDKAYRPRNGVLLDGKVIVGDVETSALAVLDEGVATHFGEAVGWRFDTLLLYNSAKAAIVHTLELIGLPGRASGAPIAYLSFTEDGETWTQERANRLGVRGERAKRTQWSSHKRFRNYMGCRFRGDSDGLAGWAALEAETEALKV
jgi:hypothetical protein